MKITKFEKQKKSDRISVFINNEFAFGVTPEELFDYELYVGKELTLEEINKIKDSDKKAQAFAYILYLLGFGSKTKKEIIKKMQKKGIEQEAQEFAIKKAQKYGYIDDSQYCENFINQHKNMSGWGEKKIFSALIQKGVEYNLAKEKLEELYSKEESLSVAFNCAKKKLEILNKREKDPQKIKQKLYAFLVSRGYSYEVIQIILSKIKEKEVED